MSSIPRITVRDLRLAYGHKEVIHGISFLIQPNEIFAVIGPAQSGKTSLLRCLNRMNVTIPDTRLTGKILLDGEDFYSPDKSLISLRQRVGMVFQKPNPFPQSIFDNVAFGPRVLGLARDRFELGEIVQNSLQSAALYDDVKDKLNSSANYYSEREID